MKAQILLFGLLFGLSSATLAQYKIGTCKATGYKAETCLQKEFQDNEEFYASDIASLRKLAVKYPNLPWQAVIDSNNSLVSDLSQGTSTIIRQDRGRFIDLLESLKKQPNTSDLLEATEIFLKSNPSDKFYFSNKDPKLMQKFAETLSGKQTPQPSQQVNTAAINRCKPNQAKYREIMDDMNRCGGKDVDSKGGMYFYTALAEIAACERFEIEQIGVIETMRAKGLSLDKPCVISMKGSSGSIGAGHIEIKTNGEVKTIQWGAGYDLFDTKNDLNFWRSQLYPQVEAAYSNKPSAIKAGPGTADQKTNR